MGQAVSSVPQHDGMSTQQHVSFPQHAHQLAPTCNAKTTVPVVGTVSRRIDPEQTELEEDSIPRPATDVRKFFTLWTTPPCPGKDSW